MGFFTRQTAQEARKAKRGARRQPPIDVLRALGVAGARSMNPNACNPELEPSGVEDPAVLVLGGFPDEESDGDGEGFSSEAGEFLRDELPRWGSKSVRYDYCVRTLPPIVKGKRRNPTAAEIECFRTVVTEDIERTKPRVILGLGNIPLKWLTGLTNVKAVRGKRFPVKVGKHVCWYLPACESNPDLFLGDRRDDKVPPKEWYRFWKMDIHKAFDLADSDEVPEVIDPNEAAGGVVHCLTLKQVGAAVSALLKSKHVGFDIETNGLRPYFAESYILSVAFSDGARTFSIPIDHPQSPWVFNSNRRGKVLKHLRRLFDSTTTRLIAHNLPFDLEWMEFHLGGVLDGLFGCSLQASFALDPGPPGDGAAGHALDDLCLRHFGLGLKALSPGAQWVKRLQELPLEKVLGYNALDAKWCLLLWQKLMFEVIDTHVLESYELQMDRIPTILNAQKVGIPVDQEVRSELAVEVTTEVQRLEAAIAKNKDVRKYVKKFGAFQPGSAQDVGKLFGTMLGVLTVKTDHGAYATGAEVLDKFKGAHPVLELILKLRQTAKLVGTYITRFDPKEENTYVGTDSRVHCQFTIARARSGRLASQEPNNQNWPKRKNKHVQRQLAAPPGWIWIAADQGQIEARVLAMESLDQHWVRALTEGLDVHQDWAERIAAKDVGFGRLLDSDPKAARQKAKNGWVFPAFYGSAIGSIKAALELDEDPAEELFEEFWEEFHGVKRWQQAQWASYQKRGYVKGLTGRKRLGPLSYNMVINTPIQGVASDICVDAMNRLYWRSLDEKLPWLAPVMQVHDDLKNLVPESEVEYAVEAIVEEQLAFKADWVNVPLTVEVEVGYNLAEMEAIGEWSSDAA